MSQYAKRRDINQDPTQSAYEMVLGGHITDCSRFGEGFPDLLVSFGGEFCEPYIGLVEIKRDAKAEYTAHQIQFRKRHPGCVKRIETVEQAIEHAAWIRQQVKKLAV